MTKKILLAEDDLFIRDLYKRVLVQAGFDVTTASDGMQTIELAKTKPDLLLLDIMMPKLNGIAVLQALRKDKETKDIHVVLLTNLGQDSIIAQAKELGVSDYLIKMRLTPYGLVDHVKKVIEKK